MHKSSLDRKWLQCYGNSSGTGDGERQHKGCDNERGEATTDSVGGNDAGGAGRDGYTNPLAVGERKQDTRGRSPHRVGEFFLFLANVALSVIGKVIDTRVTGERPCQKIRLHYFTPTNIGSREGAATR